MSLKFNEADRIFLANESYVVVEKSGFSSSVSRR